LLIALALFEPGFRLRLPQRLLGLFARASRRAVRKMTCT
jgi:hypothetical protein